MGFGYLDLGFEGFRESPRPRSNSGSGFRVQGLKRSVRLVLRRPQKKWVALSYGSGSLDPKP